MIPRFMVEVPVRDLEVGQWVYLEYADIVHITELTWFADWVEVTWVDPKFPGTVGTWSARFDDVPFLRTYRGSPDDSV